VAYFLWDSLLLALGSAVLLEHILRHLGATEVRILTGSLGHPQNRNLVEKCGIVLRDPNRDRLPRDCAGLDESLCSRLRLSSNTIARIQRRMIEIFCIWLELEAEMLDELDRACPDQPLLVAAYSFHEGVLNSCGLEEMGWTAASSDPPNGMLVRKRGSLTGEVAEQAFYLAEATARDSLLETGADAWLAELDAWKRDAESRAERYAPGFVLADSRETPYREREDAQL